MVLKGRGNPRKWVEEKNIWRKENFAFPPFLILSQSAPIFHELGNRTLGNCLYVWNKKKKNKSKTARPTDGHVKKRKPSVFLKEYYSTLFLSLHPLRENLLILEYFSFLLFHRVILFIPSF
jgi:hypothetical protein